MKKSKMAVRGGLTNSCEKKGSKKQRRSRKIYYLNAEFQRIARRVKKAFLSDQGKEIEENNRMGKTRDLFKSRDTKGIFHAKMGSIKDRNGMDLTAAATAKLLQSCPTLCDPIDGSPLGSAIPGILQARVLEWIAISFSNA